MKKRGKPVREAVQIKKTAIEKIGEVLEMPTYDIAGTPCIEMIGNREFMVENCKGIIEYSQETIRVSAGKYVIKLCGRGMILIGMQEKNLHIQGIIETVEFII